MNADSEHGGPVEQNVEGVAGGNREDQQREREDGRPQLEANLAAREEGEGQAGGEVETPDTRPFTPPQELQLVHVVKDSGTRRVSQTHLGRMGGYIDQKILRGGKKNTSPMTTIVGDAC